MAITWTNRKGDIYYLHEGQTKTGKNKYYFSKSNTGNLVFIIPDGYEIYENPNAQVFMRRKLVSPIKNEELELVDRSIRKYLDSKYFIIDYKKKTITIYLKDQEDYSHILNLTNSFNIANKKLINILDKFATYTPMLRFTLENEKKREFIVERFCFLGSIDDWIFLSSSSSLEEILNDYCPHLGKELFYNLM
ncbi:hypothetical protein KAU33_10435 [Candidatus Dependentiae bacterium]|nr:hypothetical protein [Candidatus Dependentiae bacterium]